jgi:hypothetical protein
MPICHDARAAKRAAMLSHPVRLCSMFLRFGGLTLFGLNELLELVKLKTNRPHAAVAARMPMMSDGCTAP